jgi:hypothetical protein
LSLRRRASTDNTKYIGNKPESRRDGVELKPYGTVDSTSHHNMNVDVDMDAMNGGVDFHHQQSNGIYANIDHGPDGNNGYAMQANDGYSEPDHHRPDSSSSSMTSYRGRNGHLGGRMRHQELSPGPNVQGAVTINGVAVH